MTDAEVKVLQTEVAHMRDDIAELKDWLKWGLRLYVVTMMGAVLTGLINAGLVA